jgi:hypothetical protein
MLSTFLVSESGGTVDAVGSKSTGASHGGSNPPSRTKYHPDRGPRVGFYAFVVPPHLSVR